MTLDKLVGRYDLNIKGVIHIGANIGQEYPDYEKQGIKNMIFFEPVTSVYAQLVKNLPNDKHIKTFKLALGDIVEERKIFIARNKGQSSSLLKPTKHLYYSPRITFNESEIVKVDKLDNIEFDRRLFNMIVVDVQGYELNVFKGATKTLKSIDIIYSEINFEELYQDCVLVGELDAYLKKFGFIRILTDDKPKSWGDALYLKY